jgi:hypothetical protein
VEEMTTVEDDDVGAFAAVLGGEDVAVAETAAGRGADEDRALLLLDELFV